MSADPDLRPVVPPADAEGISQVIGGVGGIRFQWEELDNGARTLSAAAAELHRVWASVSGIEMRLSAVRGHRGLVSAGSATTAGWAAAQSIQAGIQRLSEDRSSLTDTADRITISRERYEMAELLTTNHVGRIVADLLPSVPHPPGPLVLVHTKSHSIPFEGTVDSLLSRVRHAQEEPGSSFEVLEVEGRSGPAYVVVIPGTEWSRAKLPFSGDGILEAKFEDSAHVNVAVAGALAEVGAPSGASVLLVGHSQGGMHAVNLANSGPVSENYSVDVVVTAGSPVTEEEAPEKTSFLHLAHEKDWVPVLNLVPPPDRPNQVFVTLDHEVTDPPGGNPEPHSINEYRQGARAVDLSSHPSIAPVTSAVGAAVAGSTARRHVFQVSHYPLQAPGPVGERRTTAASVPGAGDRARDK